MGFLRWEPRLSLTLLPALGLSPPTGWPPPALIGEEVPGFTAIGHRWLVSSGGLPFSEENQRRGGWEARRGKVRGRTGRKGGGSGNWSLDVRIKHN